MNTTAVSIGDIAAPRTTLSGTGTTQLIAQRLAAFRAVTAAINALPRPHLRDAVDDADYSRQVEVYQHRQETLMALRDALMAEAEAIDSAGATP